MYNVAILLVTQMNAQLLFKALSIVAISLLCSTMLNAQVTVGSGNTPNKGALLDIKQYDAEDPATSNTTATKGLMLPRVNLTEMNNLYPMFIENEDYKNNTGNKKTDEDAIHTGLVVYNINMDLCEEIYPGVHTWDGNEWHRIGEDYPFPSETDILVDNRNPDKPERYRVGRFKAVDPSGSGKVADAGWWMLENLRADRWPDGTTDDFSLRKGVAYGHEDYDVKARYWYPLNDQNELIENPHYGYIYNWVAAARIKSTDPEYPPNELGDGDDKQGICPEGWHIPSYAEFQLLVAVLQANPCPYAHSKIGANTSYNMQSSKTTPNGKSRSREQGGFDAHLLGRHTDGTVLEVSKRAYFHMSDWGQGTNSKRVITFDAGVYAATIFPIPLFTQIPVRCKKD